MIVDTHQESRKRVVDFKAAVVERWYHTPEMTDLEYQTALADLLHDISARLLAAERKKAHKKNRKKAKRDD